MAVIIDPIKHMRPILLTTFALSLLMQYLAPYIDAKIPKKPINPIALAITASDNGVWKWVDRNKMHGNVQLLNPNNS